MADRLEEHFGPDRVFRDDDSIVAGENFPEAIRLGLERSVVVLAIIGPRWLAAANAKGQRLDDPAYLVHREIEFALSAGIAVPVLVDGVGMPAEADLPSSLQVLTRCQAVELSASRWHYDVDRLINVLHRALQSCLRAFRCRIMPRETMVWGSV